MQRDSDTQPGSERRAVDRALRSAGRRLSDSVYLNPDQIARMSEADIYTVLDFRPRCSGDVDHNETSAELDRAVRALVELDMAIQIPDCSQSNS